MLLLLLCLGCKQHGTGMAGGKADSLAMADTVVKADDEAYDRAEADDVDWAPEEFKREHPDEWAVVNRALQLQQREGDFDFAELDKLVREYIAKKRITLPDEKFKQIERIGELCKKKFDIWDYDESNLGMRTADSNRRLFDEYVGWLYEQEAAKVLEQTRLVDMDKELELYNGLNKAYYNVCDSVTGCMDDSDGWWGRSQVYDLVISFRTCMYQAIAGAKVQTGKELDVPLKMFDDECKAVIDNYEPFFEEMPTDVSPCVNRFKEAFHAWYAYRKQVAQELKDARFRKAYKSITYSQAREYFISLKNRFSDVGLMSGDVVDMCLHDESTNKEILEFNFEKKEKEYNNKW